MPDFKGLQNLDLIVFFIVPGLIITYVRSRFISGKPPSHTENLLSYLVLSLAYYSIAIIFLRQALAVSGPWWAQALVRIGLTLVGPTILGFVLGAWAQKDYGSWLANKFELSLVHVIPTAWGLALFPHATRRHVCHGDPLRRGSGRRFFRPEFFRV